MTPRLRWLKLHLDARTDAKLALLSAEQFRVWFRLLCYSAEREPRGIIDNESPHLVAVECAGGDQALLDETVSLLLRLGILEAEGFYLAFAKWAERQYEKPSDYPEHVRERVERHRQGKRQRDGLAD